MKLFIDARVRNITIFLGLCNIYQRQNWKYSYELFTDARVRNMIGKIKKKREIEKEEHILSNFKQNLQCILL